MSTNKRTLPQLAKELDEDIAHVLAECDRVRASTTSETLQSIIDHTRPIIEGWKKDEGKDE